MTAHTMAVLTPVAVVWYAVAAVLSGHVGATQATYWVFCPAASATLTAQYRWW